MKTLEKGHDKIKKLCSVIRDETLEPAQLEAQAIVQAAEERATEIIAEAKSHAAKTYAVLKVELEKERQVFQASLQQAMKQSLEALRQSIEEKFFNVQLASLVENKSADPQLVAQLINAIVKALEKDGLAADLAAVVPETIQARQVNGLILEEVLKTLKGHSVEIGDFAGGVQVKLGKKGMTIDMTDEALRELLATYLVRKDFRKMVFFSSENSSENNQDA